MEIHTHSPAPAQRRIVAQTVQIRFLINDNRFRVMRLPFKKILLIGLAAAILYCLVFQIFRIKNSVQKTLAEQSVRLNEKNRVPFEKKVLAPHISRDIQILQSANATSDFVKFRRSYFAASGGGLAQFTENGKLIKHFTILDGLPESDLTALAVYNDRLFIGTRAKTLVSFDGERFENYTFADRAAQTVTALLASEGKLLVGTLKGGLLEFDGENFVEIQAENKRIFAANCLYKDGAKLVVGTFDDGLWIYEADVWTHFTTGKGLPSNRVVGIARKDKNLYVATDFGLAILQDETFRTLAVLPALSGLILHGNQIFLAKDDGRIFTFEDSLKEFSGDANLRNARLVATDEKFWLVSNQGISEIRGAQIKSFSRAETDSLTDNFVSALAFDKRENLWIGTFRNGIDVFGADGKKLRHLESESVREINFLQGNAETVSAATASGLINFKADFSAEILTKTDGLPSNSITHFSGSFLATAKGLAFPDENGKFRVLSTVQNLPNNSVCAVLQTGKKLYAGTLGGLAEIENNRVVRTFKDSNSNLKTNWVTALIRANERLFIGTYGGGVFELLPSGEIRSFEAETGKFAVNPNAVFADGERLYIGTLVGAKVLDLRTHEWKTVKKVLPSETVLSIAGAASHIYFGTASGIARIDKSYFEKGESE